MYWRVISNRRRGALRAVVVVLSIVVSVCAHADEIVGKVVGVYDGDTITVLDAAKTQHKIRLAEIDTPERSQAFGTKAKQALSSAVFGKNVTIKYDTKDRYGRIVGTVYVRAETTDDGQQSVNVQLVASGMAWHYKSYSKSKELAKAESTAREKKLGLWADKDPTPPWEFRRSKMSKKRAQSTAVASTNTTGQGYWLNTSSNSRHNPSCKYFNNTKRGRVGNATEGKACGICGG